MNELGIKIKVLRKRMNITQEDLAERLGVSFQAVSKWETNAAYPDISMFPVLANFFNVTTDELLGVDLSKKKEKIAGIIAEYDR
ncbi:MAG TPA: XRE family transcriptional regulator, partial [Clostridiales bacterium]|nr:XRE family transcriptional regulator [Clostridiales bacterium]